MTRTLFAPLFATAFAIVAVSCTGAVVAGLPYAAAPHDRHAVVAQVPLHIANADGGAAMKYDFT